LSGTGHPPLYRGWPEVVLLKVKDEVALVVSAAEDYRE
jgi:hypothetical protein